MWTGPVPNNMADMPTIETTVLNANRKKKEWVPLTLIVADDDGGEILAEGGSGREVPFQLPRERLVNFKNTVIHYRYIDTGSWLGWGQNKRPKLRAKIIRNWSNKKQESVTLRNYVLVGPTLSIAASYG